jgi:hypothetical protein
MKTIYANNSYDSRKELCYAEDTIVRAFESAGVQFTREDNRFISVDNELEVIILDTYLSSHKGELVLTQGSLFYAIESFFKQLWKIKTKSFHKVMKVIFTDTDDIIEVGIDFVTDCDDWGDEYQSIDDIVFLGSNSVTLSGEVTRQICEQIANLFDNYVDFDDFMELVTEIEVEIN